MLIILHLSCVIMLLKVNVSKLPNNIGLFNVSHGRLVVQSWMKVHQSMQLTKKHKSWIRVHQSTQMTTTSVLGEGAPVNAADYYISLG